ncbi:MAG: glycosyltransferase family 2 protein [Candidatus Bathyarchaeota archaeon]|nr:glycosyltransferase family 2 protein [Candidatus Bathyarchaeota archaeon]
MASCDKLLFCHTKHMAMPSCSDPNFKVDFVVPSRDEANPTLLRQIKSMPCAGEIINTHEKPLSVARKHAVLQAKTEWVAMVDDDMLLPRDWLQNVSQAIAPDVGAIGTVAVHKNRHAAAYERVVGTVYNLSKLDTNPHINNILIRRKVMENYNPPKLFFGEDQYFKRYVQKSGYKWKVLPFLGATHLGTSKNYVTIGVSYRRYGHYSMFKLLRRVVARFLFTPYAALSNLSAVTFYYLTKLNVEFIAGWAKELLTEKL